MANDKPHVLLISTDHWSASLLGEANHPAILTPTLDELARSGTRFVNAYSECPVCIPARRTLMTGTSPRTHGDRVFKTTAPMPELPTVAQTFRDRQAIKRMPLASSTSIPSATALVSTTCFSTKRAGRTWERLTTTISSSRTKAMRAWGLPTA